MVQISSGGGKRFEEPLQKECGKNSSLREHNTFRCVYCFLFGVCIVSFSVCLDKVVMK